MKTSYIENLVTKKEFNIKPFQIYNEECEYKYPNNVL